LDSLASTSEHQPCKKIRAQHDALPYALPLSPSAITTERASSRLDRIRIPKDQDSVRASTNLYIYQRSEYDEGMQTFSSPVSVPCGGIESSPNPEQCRITIMMAILYNLGQLHVRIGEDEKAADFFDRALILGRTPDGCLDSVASKGRLSTSAILHNLGHIKYRGGHYTEALEIYTECTQYCF